jgi:HTH-type transcriptional regulator / antitoxin MqsA
LIGGGPRAFQKYESGDLLPSRAISNALILLDRDPDALSVLKTPRKAV